MLDPSCSGTDYKQIFHVC